MIFGLCIQLVQSAPVYYSTLRLLCNSVRFLDLDSRQLNRSFIWVVGYFCWQQICKARTPNPSVFFQKRKPNSEKFTKKNLINQKFCRKWSEQCTKMLLFNFSKRKNEAHKQWVNWTESTICVSSFWLLHFILCKYQCADANCIFCMCLCNVNG